MKTTCEICDEDGMCESGRCPCSLCGEFIAPVPPEVANGLLTRYRNLLDSVQALGVMPEGYCFCSNNRVGDDSKVHQPECANLREALAAESGSFAP